VRRARRGVAVYCARASAPGTACSRRPGTTTAQHRPPQDAVWFSSGLCTPAMLASGGLVLSPGRNRYRRLVRRAVVLVEARHDARVPAEQFAAYAGGWLSTASSPERANIVDLLLEERPRELMV